MTRARLSPRLVGALVLAAGTLFVTKGFGDTTKITAVKTGPSFAQMNDPKVQIAALDQRVTDLEQKIGTLQRQLAAAQQHTHSYNAPHCQEFVSVLNLRDAVDHPGGHAGMGVCMIRPTTAGFPQAQTSAPGK